MLVSRLKSVSVSVSVSDTRLVMSRTLSAMWTFACSSDELGKFKVERGLLNPRYSQIIFWLSSQTCSSAIGARTTQTHNPNTVLAGILPCSILQESLIYTYMNANIQHPHHFLNEWLPRKHHQTNLCLHIYTLNQVNTEKGTHIFSACSHSCLITDDIFP